MIRIKKWKRQSWVARTYSSSTDENVNPPPSFHHTLSSSYLSSVLMVRSWRVYLKLCPAAAWMYAFLSACCVCSHENVCSHIQCGIGSSSEAHCCAEFDQIWTAVWCVCTHVCCSSIRTAVEVQSEYLCQLTAHLQALLQTEYVHTHILYLLYCTVRDEG